MNAAIKALRFRESELRTSIGNIQEEIRRLDEQRMTHFSDLGATRKALREVREALDELSDDDVRCGRGIKIDISMTPRR